LGEMSRSQANEIHMWLRSVWREVMGRIEKESQYTKDEIKDVMAHLYFKMKETMAAQQPVDVRILKYLLSMEDPLERREKLGEVRVGV